MSSTSKSWISYHYPTHLKFYHGPTLIDQIVCDILIYLLKSITKKNGLILKSWKILVLLFLPPLFHGNLKKLTHYFFFFTDSSLIPRWYFPIKYQRIVKHTTNLFRNTRYVCEYGTNKTTSNISTSLVWHGREVTRYNISNKYTLHK